MEAPSAAFNSAYAEKATAKTDPTAKLNAMIWSHIRISNFINMAGYYG